MNGFEYDESYDESDLESAFEDLEYDEARRRRRRGRGRGRRGARVPVPAPRPRRDGDANLQRQQQLARAVNVVDEDVASVEARLAKVNSDVARLRQLSMVSLLLPRGQDLTRRRLTFSDGRVLGVEDNPQGQPGESQVDVVTNVTTKLDIIPLVLFMSMGRGIGTPGRGGAAASSDMNMMLPLVILMDQQQRAQASGQAGTQASGGLDTTMLLVLMMSMGGLS